MVSHDPTSHTAIDDDVAPLAVRRFSHAPRTAPRQHAVHSYAVLSFWRSGRGTVDVGGEFALEAGDVLLVPAGVPHRTISVDGADAWGLALCTACVARGADAHLLDGFARVREGASPVVDIGRERADFVEHLFRELEDTVRARAPLDARALTDVERSLLTLLMHEVARARGASTRDVSGRERAPSTTLVARALALIERECLRPLSLDAVAGGVGVSRAHLARTVMRETGRTVGAWITEGRLAEARRLLARSALTVDDVALRVGYADATHFIRTFRRHHGATPAAWRTAARR